MRHLFTHHRVRQHLSQGFRFVIVGTTGAAVDLGSLTFFVEILHFPLTLAFTCSSVLALTVVFFFNKYFTFRNREAKHLQQYGRFLLIYSVSLFMNVMLASFLAHAVHLWYPIAKTIPILIIAVWNYCWLHGFIFTRQRSSVPPPAAT